MKNDEEGSETEEDKMNDEWVKENFVDLIQSYPRRWIAVLDRKVIADAGSRAQVEETADELAGDRDYSVYFIPPTETTTDIGYYSHEEERKDSD